MEFEPNVYSTESPVQCEWFALCENLTSIAVVHPILGATPICQRCAERVGMKLETE